MFFYHDFFFIYLSIFQQKFKWLYFDQRIEDSEVFDAEKDAEHCVFLMFFFSSVQYCISLELLNYRGVLNG